VPDLLTRRQTSAPPPKRKRARGIFTFALGAALGYAVASPYTQQLPALSGQLLASLSRGPKSLAAMVNPLAFNQHRVLVLGRDNVADNTDVMFPDHPGAARHLHRFRETGNPQGQRSL
jgi:hypothetical protein